MEYIKDEKKLGYVPLGSNSAIGVTTGVGLNKRVKGKAVVDIRLFYRALDIDFGEYAQQQKDGTFPVVGLKPSQRGLLLDRETFVGLMKEYLIPYFNEVEGA